MGGATVCANASTNRPRVIALVLDVGHLVLGALRRDRTVHESARQLGQFGLHNHFGRVVASVDVGWRKPHPRIYEAALRDCQVSPRNAVFVGDNWAADVEGPRRVGMSAIYVGPPTEERQAVTLKEIPEIVRSLD
jgi:HAD superfamily hydrolase (TIGR01509 family)